MLRPVPQRFDRSELRKPRKTREGWLRADGYLSRTGVQEYRKDDGSLTRELRTPEEVFHPDALASFAMVPLTLEHPQGPVTANNWRSLAVGTTGEAPKRDGDFVHATLAVTEPSAIRDLESGARVELSCGYTCDVVAEPGEWNGLKYDALQKNIRGNHVALVSKGRAGPQVRVRMDAADAIDSSLSQDASTDAGDGTPGGTPMAKYKIDGVEFEVSEQAKQALEVQEGKRTALDSKARSDLEIATKAKTDAEASSAELTKKLAESEKARADGADPKKVAELVKARVALHAIATPILGNTVKLDELDDKAVKVAVCEKLIPGWKADGVADGVLEGAFTTAVALKKTATPTGVAAARAAVHVPAGTRSDAGGDDIDKAQQAFLERSRTAWKPKEAAAK